MQSIVINGKLDLGLEGVPMPEPEPGQIRLRVDYVGICGSDLHYYYEGANGAFVVREPLVPGHELSGEVDLDPEGTLAPGTPVTVHPARFGTPRPHIEDDPHLWPGGSYLGSASTRPHTQGAMSEYLIVDSGMVRVLPEALPVRRAVLAEPLAVGLHAVSRAGSVDSAEVLVSGAGPIGLLTAAAARIRGAARVTVSDVLPEPLTRALELGADAVIRVPEQDVPDERFDVVFECAGAPSAISGAVRAVRRRGTVVQIGMVPDQPRPVCLAPLVAKEAALVGAFRFHQEIDEAVRVLAEHPELEQVITHVIPAGEAVAAFETARDAAGSGKVVIDMHGHRRSEVGPTSPAQRV
ncbi:zinc-binding dehydrogenase [Pseudonocardia sp. NPDC046786]|uniref:zinc-binding dehydrogenase n=1 Tax=Pseudonocardia sp. NPDC046786 TaxID=3155471 RepID=UPI0033E81286